jgi:DNA-binding response OmpR family regulator
MTAVPTDPQTGGTAAAAPEAAGGLPRVVLVDDDPAIRRLVALALEDQPLSLQLCASVAEARAALRAGPVQLLLTDLMMPGETGHDLLQQLHDQPDLAQPTRVAVFSAGLDAVTQARLTELGVWRQLLKPVAMSALLATVHEALSGAAPQAVTAPGAPASGPTESRAAVPMPSELTPAQQRAVVDHFAGDVALFQAYRHSCGPLFADDIVQGDAALERGDIAALRRLGHSLKSVLRSLGESAAADAAQALDSAACAAGASPLVEEPGDGLISAWKHARLHLAPLAAGQ